MHTATEGSSDRPTSAQSISESRSSDRLIPDSLVEVFQEFRTTEFTTLDRRGMPVTWPVLPFYDPATGKFSISTSIGLPQKAFNVRRDGRVALLFSDATGAGLTDPPTVLVQGDAVAPDQIITDRAGHEEIWAQIFQRQPNSALYTSNALLRYLFDWYYMRLFIHITPRRILWWENQDFSRTPQELVLVDPQPSNTVQEKAGQTAVSTSPAAKSQSANELTKALAQLPNFSSVVLTGFDANAYPTSIRCQVQIDNSSQTVQIQPPGAHEIETGPANLLAHYHNENLWKLRSVSLRGQLSQASTGLQLQPQQASENSGSLVDIFGFVRNCRRSAKNYLARRNLARPKVPWNDIIDVKKSVAEQQQ